MGSLLNVGKKAGEALGASLFTAAGQLITSSASGVASILSNGTSGQYLTTDGTTLSWGSLPVYQRVAVVASDVTHTQSNTTLSDVTGLAVPVTASATEKWLVEAFLLVTAANATVDVKFGWTYPTGLTMSWGPANAATNVASWNTFISTTTPAGLNNQTVTQAMSALNGTAGIPLIGIATSGGTAGNLQLQFAQNTSDASNLVVKAGSVIRYTRLAT